MHSIASVTPERKIVVGVDTHKHLHVAVALDELGARLGELTISADSAGYATLAGWAEQIGKAVFGIEGTGSYGVGLASFLRRRGHTIIEVNRGDRRGRRANGKSDTLDAEAAARAVLAGEARAVPKSADGACEMIRQVKIARDTAVKARTQALITLKCNHRERPRRAARATLAPDRQEADRPLRRPPARPDRLDVPPPSSTRSERSHAAGSTSPTRSPATTVSSSNSPLPPLPACARASGSAPTPRPKC